MAATTPAVNANTVNAKANKFSKVAVPVKQS